MFDIRLHETYPQFKMIMAGLTNKKPRKHKFVTCPVCLRWRYVRTDYLDKNPDNICFICSIKKSRAANSNKLMSKVVNKCVSCGKNFKSLKKTWIRGTKKCSSCRTRESQNLGHGISSMNSVYSGYKTKCKKKGLDFKISKELFMKMIILNCHYCDSVPSNDKKSANNTGDFSYNGIDRIDNDNGYIDGNIVTCCKICNYAKNTMSYDDFLSWIKKAYKHIHRSK